MKIKESKVENKEEIIKKIDELKENIDISEAEVREIENQIEDLERDLDFEKNNLDIMYNQLEYYEKELLKLQTPQEQIPYWIGYIHDSCRNQLDGQFERNGKWYVCNGYVLLESNNKFDSLEVCEGIDSLPKLLDAEKEEISFGIEKYNNEWLGADITIGKDLMVSGTYLIACKNILQLNNNSKLYTSCGQSSSNKDRPNLICENENGRALILSKIPRLQKIRRK